MHIESQELFPVCRIQMKTYLSDQSTEKKTANSTIKLAPSHLRELPANLDTLVEWPAGVDGDFLWPLCIDFHDTLHILYDGALKTAITRYQSPTTHPHP